MCDGVRSCVSCIIASSQMNIDHVWIDYLVLARPASHSVHVMGENAEVLASTACRQRKILFYRMPLALEFNLYWFDRYQDSGPLYWFRYTQGEEVVLAQGVQATLGISSLYKSILNVSQPSSSIWVKYGIDRGWCNLGENNLYAWFIKISERWVSCLEANMRCIK